MMTPAEHYREAERLLELAAVPMTVVTVLDNITQDQADKLQEALMSRGMGKLTVVPESIKVDASALLVAAQVHATLAVAGSQMRSLGIEHE